MIADQLAELLKDEITPLRRFALLLTRSYEDAEDLAQDTIERALLKAHLFDGANLRSWLFTVCRRIFLNQVRKNNSRGASIDIADAPQAAVCVQSDQDSTLEFHQTMDCLKKLPRRDQAILSLIVFDGARYDEAAESLELPIGTVRSRLSRARGRLHQLIEKGGRRRPGRVAAVA
jgi:RNA polymerase sigma-70 factor (ECF subfamily)